MLQVSRMDRRLHDSARVYAMAHNHVHGTKIQQGVVLMCSKDGYFQEFIVSEKEPPKILNTSGSKDLIYITKKHQKRIAYSLNYKIKKIKKFFFKMTSVGIQMLEVLYTNDYSLKFVSKFVS